MAWKNTGEKKPGKKDGHTNGFAHAFYTSRAWKACRENYWKLKGGLCERCLARGIFSQGDEVHHKVRLTPENITDPNVALSFDNLELLCKRCHLDEHRGIKWRTDENGRVLW